MLRRCMLIVLFFLKELELTHGQVPWKTWMTSKYELKVFDTTPVFEGAKTICTNNDGYLMRLDDPEVNSTVYEKVQDTPWKFFWIGATGRMHNWTWLDGMTVNQSLLRWYKDQPDNYNGKENRILMRKSDMKVGDIPPSFTFAGTICQRNLISVNSISADDLELTDEGRTKIKCTAEGFPTPTVEWTNISSSPKDGIYQLQSPGWAEIHFENATVRDEGGYKCVANNTLGGVKYEKSVTVRLTVPSHPTISKINPFPCNSSLEIVWKPHSRAIKVEHIIQIRKNSESKNADEEERVTPNDFTDQIFISKNLSSRSVYNVSITACPHCSSPYTSSGSNRTWGKLNQVEVPMLQKENGSCVVYWTLPKNISRSVITGFKIKTSVTTATVSSGVQQSATEIETILNNVTQSFTIPKQPNKKYKVTIQAQNCAGFGDHAFATESCKTDVSAPEFIEPPIVSPRGGSGDGKLDIKLSIPSEENGTMSCIFIIIERGNSLNLSSANEMILGKLNMSESGDQYIAIAITKGIFGEEEELNLVLGDESTTSCKIFVQDANNTRQGLYFGQNKPLLSDSQYKIYVVTATPSSTIVYFQTSEALMIETKPAESLPTSDWKIPVIAVVIVVILIILIALAILVILRKRKNKAEKDQMTSLAGEVNAADKAATSFSTSRLTDRCQSPKEEPEQNEVLYENCMRDTSFKMADFESHYSRLCQEQYSLFKSQFKVIKERSASARKLTTVGEGKEMKKKNRYKNILPYDSTRVVIKGNSDGYINACFVDGFQTEKKFIATQGPLHSTLNDFWLMVVENKCKTIVMLAKCYEGGKKKCEKYWPDGGKSEKYGNVVVKNEIEMKISGFIQRKFRLFFDDESTEVVQFQYQHWPDHGVPITTSALHRLHKAVNKAWKCETTHSPIIVHCSAGVGRTGTFIGFNISIEQARENGAADIFNCTLIMRSQRVDMIQNCDQYILVHKLLLEHHLFTDTELDPSDIPQKLADMEREDCLSTEFKDLSRVTPLQNLSKKEEGNPHSVLILPQGDETTPPRIAANWIESHDESNTMIAAKTPSARSAPLFWRAVSSNRVNTIITLGCGKVEEQHLPGKVGETHMYAGVAVLLVSEGIDDAITERTIQISSDNTTWTVTQYHYSRWEENNCPANSRYVIDLIAKMSKNVSNEKSTTVVHCSDGLGRTGTFCAIVNLVARLQVENLVDVFKTIKDLRDCRPGMVKNLEQYIFCHRVIVDYMRSFETYANFN